MRDESAAHRLPLDGGAMLRAAGWSGPQGQALFDPDAYGAQARPVGEGGRQSAWFVRLGQDEAVLRHYRRGGLVGRVVRQSYLWLGEERTRPFAEFRVMSMLRAQGLRVPRPLAAAYWRCGAVYRGALLTARIPAAQPLASAIDEPVAQAVGEAIAGLHQAGVWHADLNAYNILLDAERRVWLIDFDRARAGGLTNGQRQGNLRRLRRSLVKVAGPRGLACWERIARAYAAAWPGRPAGQ